MSENIVYIGNKPINSYVMACVNQFNKGDPEIVLKARGRAISRAVDVAEVLKRLFLKDVIVVTNIAINTEEVQNREGRTSNISAMEITIKKNE